MLRTAIALVLATACATNHEDTTSRAIDLGAPWQRYTIFHGLCDATHQCSGADGVHLRDIDGDGLVDVVSPWEQSSKVTVSLHPLDPTQPWPTVVIPFTASAPEDAKFADVDGDGRWDVIVAGDASKRMYVLFGPASADILTPSKWNANITIAAASNVQNWIQVAFADLNGDGIGDIVAGGRVGANAGLGYFTNATGAWRTGSAYTYHQVSQAGVVWSLVPLDVDGDGDVDLVVSDNAALANGSTALMGSRWIENVGGGVWGNHPIHNYKGAEQLARYLHAEPGRIIDGSSRDTGVSFVAKRTTGDWETWDSTSVPYPSSGVGHYNAVRPADIDGDGCEDLVFACHHADSDYTLLPEDLSGVFWLRSDCAGSWTYGEISGPDGVKFDNLELVDVDGDGWVDVVTSEQGEAGVTPVADQLGVVWYRNPGAP